MDINHFEKYINLNDLFSTNRTRNLEPIIKKLHENLKRKRE